MEYFAALLALGVSALHSYVVSTLYYIGVRRGEALALTKRSFDFKKDEVHISHAISYPNNRAVIGTPKTFAGDRYIDMIEPYRTNIKKYIDSIDGIYLFTNTLGEVMPKTAFRRFWDTIFRKINTSAGGKQHWDKDKKKWIIDIDALNGLTPHVFRHNYATNLYYAGVDIKEAQRLMGHADAKTVIEIYTHLDKQKSKSKSKIQNYYRAI